MQVDVTGSAAALEVATAGPQTPLELAASVATAVPGAHTQSAASAPQQDSPGMLQWFPALSCAGKGFHCNYMGRWLASKSRLICRVSRLLMNVQAMQSCLRVDISLKTHTAVQQSMCGQP